MKNLNENTVYKRMTPERLSLFEESLERISNEDKKRMSTFRREEILGWLNLKKRTLNLWLHRFLNVNDGQLAEKLDQTRTNPTSPLWKLYDRVSNLVLNMDSEISSYTYWNSTNATFKAIPFANNLSSRIENLVLLKGTNNPYYTHIEALLEIVEEDGLELSNIKASLSKSILQKIEAVGISRKELRGSTATLPF